MLLNLIYFTLFAILVPTESQDIKDLDWWQKTIIYQVYPRSFKDSNGDGIGDLKGIEEKAEYFKWLGVGAIWLNPIFESPMVDFGYDISNYTRLYDKFGTIDDLKSLAEKLKELGIKLILDFVPNHTSDQCEWFKKSVDKIDPYTDYYIWKNPKGYDVNNKPIMPNNWISAFNIDPTWTWNENRKQFYLHHFHRKMPDLNYRNEKVLQEMENVIKFLLDVGVDGLRVDAVPYLVEDINFPDEEYIDPNGAKNEYYNMIHAYTKDQPETYAILRKWRKLFDNYTVTHNNETRLLLTEAYTDLNKTLMYYGSMDEPIADIPFNFELIVKLSPQSKSSDYIKVIIDWMNSMPPGKWPNWVIGNHDRQRVGTLFGAEMVDVLNILVTMLPGTAVNYYGDEIGMQNTFIRWDQTVDPQGLVLGKDKYQSGSRDGCRTPMQWDNTTNAGFSNATTTWLPVNPDYWHVNLKKENRSAKSHVNIYRKLVAARQLPTLQYGNFLIYGPDDSTVVFTRSLQDHPTFIIIMNIGSESLRPNLSSVPVVLTEDLYVYSASSNSPYYSGDKLNLTSDSFLMRPKSAIVLTTDLLVVSAADKQLCLTPLGTKN